MDVCTRIPAFVCLPVELQDAICRDEVLCKADLASLALSCKAWYSVANAVLWETLSCIESLVRLMPKEVWTGMSPCFPDRDLPSHYWESVSHLSSLVKHLYLSGIDPAFQFIIVRNTPPVTLLPSLRSLSISAATEDAFEIINAFADSPGAPFFEALTPTLQHLTFINVCGAVLCPNAGVFYKATQLTSLSVYQTDEGEADDTYDHDCIREAIIQIISNCRQLMNVYLSLPLIRHPSLLEALSRLPVLDCLTLKFYGTIAEENREDCQPDYAARGFPNLRSCFVHGLSFNEAADLIKFEGTRTLHDLRIDSTVLDSPADFAALTETIRRYCSPAHLRVIKFWRDTWVPHSDNPGHWPLSYEHAEPLTAFPRLTTVMISDFCDTTIRDAEWARMARSWPELQILYIPIYKGMDMPANPSTLVALAAFAEYCPLLRHILIPFDASNLPSLQPATETVVERDDQVLIEIGFPEDIASAEDVVGFMRSWYGKVTVSLRFPTTPPEEDLEFQRRMDLWEQVMVMTSG
ncbi:hypothetical protein HDZ31DRAFT_41056 [Schizophyllum fasciatum]